MVLRQLLEEEPPPLRRLNNLVPRDLETICLKCLAKEPSKRYRSAADLAADLRRFMNGEPIRARPIGRLERLSKWSRRNHWLAAFLAALSLGVIISTWQAVRAMGAERVARRSAANAKASESEARATLDFFRDKVLAAARPKDQDGGLGIEATIRAAIDSAEPEIARSFADQPMVEAHIRETLGTTYRCLGEPALALRQHERVLELCRQFLGSDHPYTINAINDLAIAYAKADRLEDALVLQEEELARSRKALGPDNPGLLPSMNNLAWVYRELGRIDDALQVYERVLTQCRSTLGDDHLDTLTYMNNLAVTYRLAGRAADALPLDEAIVARSKIARGPDHPQTLIYMYNLSEAYHSVGRMDDALALAKEELERSRRVLGAPHPSTLMSMTNVASLYRELGRANEALPLYEEALKHQRVRPGSDDPDTLYTMNGLAVTLDEAGRIDEAIPLYEECLRRRRATRGPDHSTTLISIGNLAQACLESKPAEAERLCRELLAIHERKHPQDWHTYHARSMLGGSLLKRRKYAEAGPLLIEGYEGMKAREEDIPVRFRHELVKAEERLSQFRDATKKPGGDTATGLVPRGRAHNP
jgi:non-specific serine/threonine protein kinase/serine/threonine-protein kinase